MFSLETIPIFLGFIGLIVAYALYKFILGFSPGSGKIVEISDEIHKGAMSFIKKEYSILFSFSLILIVGIYWFRIWQHFGVHSRSFLLVNNWIYRDVYINKGKR